MYEIKKMFIKADDAIIESCPVAESFLKQRSGTSWLTSITIQQHMQYSSI